jgi:hypothetical protein
LLGHRAAYPHDKDLLRLAAKTLVPARWFPAGLGRSH